MKSLLEEDPTELIGLEEENAPLDLAGSEDDEEDSSELMGFADEEDDDDEPKQRRAWPGDGWAWRFAQT